MLDVRTVRVRLVHRTRALVLAARHSRFGHCLPTRAHGEIPDAERQNCRRRCQLTKEPYHSPRMEEPWRSVKSGRTLLASLTPPASRECAMRFAPLIAQYCGSLGRWARSSTAPP